MEGGGAQEFREAALGCLDGLYGFALSLCRDGVQAEDLVQETFVRALAAARRPGPDDNLRAWLFTILHNVWRNEQRRRRPASLEDPVLPFEPSAPEADGPEARLDGARLAEAVRAAVDDLPDAFRDVLMLRGVEGFSYEQIARVLGCPAGTVMSRLSRGRALLRRSLSRLARPTLLRPLRGGAP